MNEKKGAGAKVPARDRVPAKPKKGKAAGRPAMASKTGAGK